MKNHESQSIVYCTECHSYTSGEGLPTQCEFCKAETKFLVPGPELADVYLENE